MGRDESGKESNIGVCVVKSFCLDGAGSVSKSLNFRAHKLWGMCGCSLNTHLAECS